MNKAIEYKSKVTIELLNLQDNAVKLAAFMETPAYDDLSPAHQSWFLIQSYGMSMYSDALKGRLEEWAP